MTTMKLPKINIAMCLYIGVAACYAISQVPEIPGIGKHIAVAVGSILLAAKMYLSDPNVANTKQ